MRLQKIESKMSKGFDGENRRYAKEARKEAGKALINLYLEKTPKGQEEEEEDRRWPI
jgi:hypothetical protein